MRFDRPEEEKKKKRKKCVDASNLASKEEQNHIHIYMPTYIHTYIQSTSYIPWSSTRGKKRLSREKPDIR